jgi:hypothetical protein
MSILSKYPIPLVLTMFLCFSATGQQLSINTKKLDQLVDQWNTIHNDRNPEAFQNIYDDQLTYYSEPMARSKAKLLKKLLFVRNPEYAQRINSDIKYTLHDNGVVKCEFTREALKKDGWESAPMYLLVGFKNHGYWIIGESDEQTDVQFGFIPRLVESPTVEVVSASISSRNATVSRDIMAKADFKDSGLATTEMMFVRNFLLYLVIALLSTGALIVFLRDRLSPKSGPEKLSDLNENVLIDDVMLEDDVVLGDDKLEMAYKESLQRKNLPPESYQVIENHLKQLAFKGYVSKQFDPLFFIIQPSEETSTPAGPGFESNIYPKLLVRYHSTSGNPVDFVIRCIYCEDTGEEIRLLPVDQGRSGQLYYAVGLGGPPDTPDELYLVPADQVTSEVVTKTELASFQKTNVFFFNNTVQKLS